MKASRKKKVVRYYEIRWIDSWMLNTVLSRVTDLDLAVSCIKEMGGTIFDIRVGLK